MPSRRPDDDFLWLGDETGATEPARAPSRVKAKVYSALLREQRESGRLMSFTELRTSGKKLCVFEQLVQIAPLGETVKSLNICRVCGARVLAERFDNPPVYWAGCPYVEMKK